MTPAVARFLLADTASIAKTRGCFQNIAFAFCFYVLQCAKNVGFAFENVGFAFGNVGFAFGNVGFALEMLVLLWKCWFYKKTKKFFIYLEKYTYLGFCWRTHCTSNAETRGSLRDSGCCWMNACLRRRPNFC